MADHLHLPDPIAIERRRVDPTWNPNAELVDRGKQATKLRGLLEGLQSSGASLFPQAPASARNSLDDEEDELDADDLGRVVLKITGKTPFLSWPFMRKEMPALGVEDGKRFFVLTNAESRRFFNELVERYGAPVDGIDDPKTWAAALDDIENIEIYSAGDRLTDEMPRPGPGEVATIDIVIWPTSIAVQNADRVAEERVAEIVGIIAFHGEADGRIQVLAADTRADTPAVHAQVDDSTLEELLEHPLVERIRGPLLVEVLSSDLDDAEEPIGELLAAGEPIGIIDDEVLPNPWLDDLVVERKTFSATGALGSPTRHGTQVAGLAAWGDLRPLLSGSPSTNPHPIYVARVGQADANGNAVIPADAPGQIANAMRWLHENGVRVVVLAFSENGSDDGALPSELSATVDNLIRELKMVVVVSSGNIPGHAHSWPGRYGTVFDDPKSRVSAPGSAANAITVGSIAHSDAHDVKRFPHGLVIAPSGETSPFSRVGPSRSLDSAGRHKPEFAGHGGNWLVDTSNGNLVVDDANIAAVTLIPSLGGRMFAAASGTSFAAPLIAHEIARIATRYPDAGPNLLRALTALAGSRHPQEVPSTPSHSNYGRPDPDRVLESEGNRAILVYEGTMPTNSIEVIPLPIPETFATGVSERELVVVLAFDPPVRRSRRDYIAGKMDFQVVHKLDLDDLSAHYSRQPTLAEAAASGIPRLPKPSHMDLRPPYTRMRRDTLIARTFLSTGAGWDPDDQFWNLVITHDHSPWTPAQKAQYPDQDFAVAVMIRDVGRPNVDLHALVRAELDRLSARSSGRVRARVVR